MPKGDYDTADFQFPIRGIDRSMRVVEQPALTCRDLQNVRAATDKGRQSGAKRPGLAKKLANAAGGTVNALKVVPRTVVDASAFKGLYETVDETWAGRYIQTQATDYPVGATSDLGANWFTARGEYVVVYRDADAASGGVDTVPMTNHYTYFTRAAGMFQSRYTGVYTEVKQGVFIMKGAPSADAKRSLLMVNYPTKNSLTMTAYCKPQARTARYAAAETDSAALPSANGSTAIHRTTSGHCEPTWCGPFVRGSANGYEYVVAYLACVGENLVQLRIDKVSGNTQTSLASSMNVLALSGRKEDSDGADPQQRVMNNDLEIELTATATQLRAAVRWPGSMTPTSDTLTVDNTDYVSNERAGVCFMHSAATSGAERHVTRLRYQRRLPTFKVLSDENQVLGYAPPLVGAVNNRYRLPTNTNLLRWKAGDATIGTAAFAAGHNAATYPTIAGVNRGVCADSTNKVVGADNGTGGDNAYHHAITKAAPATGRYKVDILPTAGLYDDPCTLGGLPASRDSVGFVSHVNTFINRHLFIEVTRTTGNTGASPSDQRLCAQTRMGMLQTVKVFKVEIAGTVTVTQVGGTLDFTAGNGDKRPVYALDAPLTFDFDGTDFVISQHGVTLCTLAGATYVPGGWSDTGVRGAYFGPSGTATTIACDGVRWTQDASTVTSVTEGTDVVAVGSSGIQQADLAVGTWSVSSASAMGSTAQPACIAENANKVYIVDGTTSVILDPINKTVAGWNSRTGGSFPAGCQILVAWRGRAVLARQLTNKPAWYMSALGDWENFDYASPATATKAYTGTLGEIGQPKEPITALIPFHDDYLVFGCVNALYILEGDPGAGGVLMTITEQVGVLNQQCWAFSDTGVLYFLGAGGLYQMQPKLRQYSALAERRVSEWLEKIDTTAYVLSLAYSPTEKGLYLFRTPIGGGAGTDHLFIDLPLEGIFRDTYPAAMQPLAVAKLGGGSDPTAGFYVMGSDGYLRYHKAGQLSDDGTAIDSWVEIGPLELGNGWLNTMVHEVEACGAIGSGTLAWQWFVGDSPEEVMASVTVAYDSAASGTSWALGAGWQFPTGLRLCGAAHKIRVMNNTTNEAWSLERLTVSYEPLARRRDA